MDTVGSDNPEDCKVCYNTFEASLRRPRNLPCGHTFCSPCVGDMIQSGHLTCPNCCIKHVATVVTQFPVSYSVESFVNRLKAIQLTEGTPEATELPAAAGTCQDYPTSISEKLQSMMVKQKSLISNCLASCQMVQPQLDKYLAQLGNWKTQHHQLVEKLNGLVDKNKEAVALLEQEEASVTDMKKKGEEGNKQLEAILEQWDTVRTASQAFILIGDTDHCNLKAENWTQKCQNVFPDVNAVHTSKEVLRVTTKALESVTTEAGAVACPVHLHDSASTIMEKVEEISGNATVEKVEEISGNASLMKTSLTVEDLRMMSKTVETMLKNGQVWTVMTLISVAWNGYQNQNVSSTHYSKITLHEGQLHLHVSTGMSLPGDAVALKHSEVVNALGPHNKVVFLDLQWGESIKGRIYIQLHLDLPIAKEFYKTCLGENGRNFPNEKFNDIIVKGLSGECIQGFRLRKCGQEIQGYISDRAGAVWAWPSGSAYYVCITTKDGKPYPRVFGEVVSGLDVVRAAANHSNIKEVTLADRGIVLTL